MILRCMRFLLAVVFFALLSLQPSVTGTKNSFPSNLNIFDDLSERPAETESEVPDIEDIKYYIHFAAAVDCNGPELSNWTCIPCLKASEGVKFRGIVDGYLLNTRATITTNKKRKEIVLAFRGSVNLRNYLADLTAIMMETEFSKTIKVHTGAWLSMKNLYNGVTELTRKQLKKHPSYKVIITGHSLGGMEASLFLYAFRNAEEFKNTPVELYTFGCPRVGNIEFARWMNAQKIKVVRVVSKSDYAPHVFTSLFGYVHFNTELWLKDNKEDYQFCSRDLLEDPDCSNSKGPFYVSSDHSNYFDTDFNACAKKSFFHYLRSSV